eukprot:14837493-Alexandrium_andersonii.AAC.1
MSASLVGSEMCIRDRDLQHQHAGPARDPPASRGTHHVAPEAGKISLLGSCLLYTSDAADDM